MKSSLAGLLGKTLTQVNTAADASGARVSGVSRALAVSLVVAAAAHAGPGLAQQVIVSDVPQAQRAQEQAHAVNEGKGVGAVLGALVGAGLTRGAAPLGKLVGIFGGGAIGASIGGRLAAPPPASPAPAAGQLSGATVISTRQYADALSRASSIGSVPASDVSANGLRPLDPQARAGMWSLALETVAERCVASDIGRELDAAALQHQIDPSDKNAGERMANLSRSYNQVMGSYARSLQQYWGAVRMAEQSSYDVSAQRTVMAVVPPDISKTPSVALDWPGLGERIARVSDSAGVQHSTYDEHCVGHQSMAESAAPRQVLAQR